MTCAHQFGDGLENDLDAFVKEHPGTRLVIIDTLQMILGSTGGNSSYAKGYDILSRLKDIADENDVCLLLVYHTQKKKAKDIFDMISGPNGIFAAADGAFVLHKDDRVSTEAVLEVTGRDQPDQRIILSRNTERLTWELVQVEAEHLPPSPDPVLEAVAALVTDDAPLWSGTATELVKATGQRVKPNTLAMHLNVNASRICNEQGIHHERSCTNFGRRVTLERISAA